MVKKLLFVSGNELKPIEIESASVNIIATERERVVLECFSSGNPKPTISWLKGKFLKVS